MSKPTQSSVNRLKSNDAGRHMISDYWDRIFSANERDAQLVLSLIHI